MFLKPAYGAGRSIFLCFFLTFKRKCQGGSVAASGRQLNNGVGFLLQTRQLSLIFLLLKCADNNRRLEKKKNQPNNNASAPTVGSACSSLGATVSTLSARLCALIPLLIALKCAPICIYPIKPLNSSSFRGPAQERSHVATCTQHCNARWR